MEWVLDIALSRFTAYSIREDSLVSVLCNDYAAGYRFVPVRTFREVKRERSKCKNTNTQGGY